jgi:hypothetical protein
MKRKKLPIQEEKIPMKPVSRSNVRAGVAVLFSQRSRDAYAAEAAEKGRTYTFTDAEGQPKCWLKGEYAYLAPNAATVLLNRYNIKSDLVEEADLTDDAIKAYKALVIANAAHLSDESIERIGRWLEETDGRLIVSGKTNLPDWMLGVEERALVPSEGFSGWRWLPASPFGDARAWEEYYVTSFQGFSVNRVTPAAEATVLADLVEFSGDLTRAATATKRPLGAGIILSKRCVFFTNQVFEFLGGMMQGHLNFEPIRQWSNPVHWGDTIALFIRRMLLDVGLAPLWDNRLRSFGAYDGCLSFRHDVHGQYEFGMLDYQIQNLIPATYDIEDPEVATTTKPHEAVRWVERTSKNNFIEQALHNDSKSGDPATGAMGTNLHAFVERAEKNLGFPVYTGGRHGGGHLHPETLDAMDYLYANNERILGLCTFSFYHMIEYGVRDPNVVRMNRALTYATDPYPTIAATGFWYPFHPTITTDKEWRVLRGWDRTHGGDCTYDMLDTIMEGRNARVPGLGRLENPVYAIQYHPQFTTDPAENDGKGTVGNVRYCINLAERLNFWIATQKDLYQRMQDYQDLAFRFDEDGTVTLHNPTDRRMAGMALERRPAFGSLWDGGQELIHVTAKGIITLPPMDPDARKTLAFETRRTDGPRIVQPSHKGLTILDARHDHDSQETKILVSVCRGQRLQLSNVARGGTYRVQVDSDPPTEVNAIVRGQVDSTPKKDAGFNVPFLVIDVSGEEDNFVERTISVKPA